MSLPSRLPSEPARACRCSQGMWHAHTMAISNKEDDVAGQPEAQPLSLDTDMSQAYMALTFPQNPNVVHTIQHEYTCLQPNSTPCPHGNFLKGVKWSPDGACLLTASEDGWMRIFDLPQDCLTCPAPLLIPPPSTDAQQAEQYAAATDAPMQPALPAWDPSQPDSMGAALRVQEGETVYDYAWYPCMNALDPQSCCFATTSRAHPIHLWDAGGGELRATYRGYNEVDEVTAAFSLAFSPDGSQIYAGYSKWILAFDVARPGRDSRRIPCSVKGPGSYSAKLSGMVSCLAFAPGGNSCLAAGTYANGIGIFDPRIPEMQLLLQGHKGGLTQMLFTNDGHFLVSGARQDPDLICWDLRGGFGGGMGEAGAVLYRMQRDTAVTNQRIGFSLEPSGRHLATGGCDGAVRVFDLQTGQRVDTLPVATDTVNGCDLHPSLNLLAVATGQRKFLSELDDQQLSPAGSVNEIAEKAVGMDGPACQHLSMPAQNNVSNTLRILRLKHQYLYAQVDGIEQAPLS